jgi:hypothetical protein
VNVVMTNPSKQFQTVSREEQDKEPHTKQQLSLWGVTWPPLKGWRDRLAHGQDPNSLTPQNRPENQYWKDRRMSPELTVGTVMARGSRAIGRGSRLDEARIREMHNPKVKIVYSRSS